MITNVSDINEPSNWKKKKKIWKKIWNLEEIWLMLYTLKLYYTDSISYKKKSDNG